MAGGVPSNGIATRPYRPADPRPLPPIRLSYSKIAATAGPCGLWPDDLGPNIDNPLYNENKQYYNFGCATSATSRPWSPIRPTWCSRARRRPPTPRGARRVREIPQGNPTATILSRSRKGQAQRHRQMIKSFTTQRRIEQAIRRAGADAAERPQTIFRPRLASRCRPFARPRRRCRDASGRATIAVSPRRISP